MQMYSASQKQEPHARLTPAMVRQFGVEGSYSTIGYLRHIFLSLKRPGWPIEIDHPNPSDRDPKLSPVKRFCAYWGINERVFYRAKAQLIANGELQEVIQGKLEVIYCESSPKVVPVSFSDPKGRETELEYSDTAKFCSVTDSEVSSIFNVTDSEVSATDSEVSATDSEVSATDFEVSATDSEVSDTPFKQAWGNALGISPTLIQLIIRSYSTLFSYIYVAHKFATATFTIAELAEFDLESDEFVESREPDEILFDASVSNFNIGGDKFSAAPPTQLFEDVKTRLWQESIPDSTSPEETAAQPPKNKHKQVKKEAVDTSARATTFQELYNENKPPAWATCKAMNSDRISALNKLCEECGTEAMQVWMDALLFVNRNSWWSGKDLSIDTLLRKGGSGWAAKLAERYTTATNIPECRQKLKKNFDTITRALGIEDEQI